MRFGVCAGPEKAEVLAGVGYDFIELSVAGDLMAAAEDADWQAVRARLLALPLPPETFNSFVRVGKIAGPDVDFSLLTAVCADGIGAGGGNRRQNYCVRQWRGA